MVGGERSVWDAAAAARPASPRVAARLGAAMAEKKKVQNMHEPG